MLQSKLIQTLKSFNKKQIIKLNEMALSPYFNKNKDVQILISTLVKHHPNYTERNSSRYILFERLWGNSEFDINKLRHVFNYALKLAEQSLAYYEFENSPFYHNLFLIEALKSNNQQIFEKKLNLQLQKNYNDYEYFMWHSLADSHYSQGADRNSNYLKQKVKYLDRFYLTEKLKSACEMLNRQRIINVSFDFSLNDDLINHLKENFDSYHDAPLVQLYYLIFIMNSEIKNTLHYENFILHLKATSNHIEHEEKLNVYNYAQNYCILKINEGNNEYLSKMFSLINQMAKENVLLENNELSERNYKNIVTVGLRLNEFKWVLNFIKSYKGFLPKDVAENAYNYNLSVYYYSNQDYDNALKLLNSVEYSDPVYNLGSKVMLLKIYFETNETEALFSLEKSFTQYLRRNKLISQPKFDRFKNLFKLTVKTHKLQQEWKTLKKQQQQLQYGKLITEINQTNQITNKAWLMEQVEKLEN